MTATAAASAAEVPALTHQLSSTVIKDDEDTTSTLSSRGAQGASNFALPEGLKRMLADPYDADTNPSGIINAGIADNSLCRTEVLQYLLAKDRLELSPADLTYADRFTTSTRLLKAIAKLFNEYSPDWPEGTGESPKPLKRVTEDHIAFASGATGILDELFWNLCDEGDGVLLSSPYYNAFDNDLTSRAKARVVEVKLPLPDLGGVEGSAKLGESLETSTFAEATVAAYEEALLSAQAQGIHVRALLLCNPHNPTGTIYPRSTVVALAKLAAKHKLHFVSDEIYARSCFVSSDVPTPARFESILSIDTAHECGLEAKFVHVVTSASKDFAVNGFRLGVLISQHNPALQRAMSSVGLLSQSASPACALWATWLNDEAFLGWYLKENRRRLGAAYEHVLGWIKKHKIPYYPSNSGFFVMLDFSKAAGITEAMADKEARKREARLVDRLLDERIFVAPGTQYHHPKPGWFRYTFTLQPNALHEALKRTEKALGLEAWEETRAEPEFDKGGRPVPAPQTQQEGASKSWLHKLVTG